MILLKNPKYNGYHRGLALIVYKVFDKRTFSVAAMLANKSAV